LEDALSSIGPNSQLQNKNIYTVSEDLEDIVGGYLKSGRVLESKLLKIGKEKHLQSLQQIPGKYVAEEMAPDEEDEDRI
jgi:hypothetical protein